MDVIATEGERGVLDSLKRKSYQANNMFSSLVKYMHKSIDIQSSYEDTKETEVPQWVQ